MFTLIKRKIQFTQGNSKIAVILINADRIFRRAQCRNFTHTRAFPMEMRIQLALDFYELLRNRDSYLRLRFIRIKTVSNISEAEVTSLLFR